MKTVVYKIKLEKEEAMQEWYLALIKRLYEYSKEIKTAKIKDSDLVIYPLNLEVILREKYLILSANEEAYKYLDELSDKVERLFRNREIKFEKEIKEK
ncbi:MAG: hypothetical protein ACFFAU_01375 [Candidatus Hodarchaeota archaeon]